MLDAPQLQVTHGVGQTFRPGDPPLVVEGIEPLALGLGAINDRAHGQPAVRVGRLARICISWWYQKTDLALASAFISYSHRDQRWLDELEVMIRPLVVDSGLSIWSDKHITPGADWRSSIEKALSEATVAVLLVSPHFLVSDFIRKHELPPLLEAARRRNLQILWIPVRDCLYEHTPIATYQSAYPTASPLAKLSGHKRDQAFKTIAKEIEKALTGSLDPDLAQQADPFHAQLPSLGGSAHPLKPLRNRFADREPEQIGVCFHRAFSRCYPGQSLGSRYPDFPSGNSSWDLFSDYFGDGRGIDPHLLQAWEDALLEPQASASERAQVVLSLVLKEASKTPASTRYSYTTLIHQGGDADYEPFGEDGSLEIASAEEVIHKVTEMLDRLLEAVRDQPKQPLVEIFVPLSLLEVNWLEGLQVKNDWGEPMLLLELAPFMIRSADRLRMGNRLPGLRAKYRRLQAGQGQWVPAEAAMEAKRLQAMHADERMVALRCPAPHTGPRERELWLQGVLSSMVPLALWPAKDSALLESTFQTSLGTLGLGSSVQSPSCPDLDELLKKRWQSHFTDPALCNLHLFVDPPDRLPLRDVLPVQSSS
jgi:hypothetical protein